MRRGILVVAIVVIPAVCALLLPHRGRTADPYVGWKTCLGCHDGYEKPFLASMHEKLFAGEKPGRDSGCEACHGAGAEHLDNPGEKIIKLKPGEASADAIAKVCLRCHDRTDKVAGFRNSRHAKKGAACTTCHNVHKAGHGEAALKDDQQALCISCHPEKRGEINMPNRHPVLEDKVSCSDCHNPHTNTKAAAKNYGKGCVKCHPEKAGPFVSEHKPVAESCLNCHSPHGGVNADLLTANEPGLCARCHADDMFTTHNLTTGAFNDCTSCHTQIHGSNSSPSAAGKSNLF